MRYLLSMYMLCLVSGTVDMKWVRARLGAKQLQYSYAWKTLLMHSSSTGATAPGSSILVVAGGSDSPIEHPNPFTGIYDAMFRTNKHRLKAADEEEIVFQPQECLTFSQALWTYTVGKTSYFCDMCIFIIVTA